MFTISTIRRIAATALVAGLAVGAASTAQAQDFNGDDILPKNKPATNNLPGFENPLQPRRPALDAKRVFVGTWRVTLKNGTRMGVAFKANGRFFLVHGGRKNQIEVGFWKISNGKLVLLPVGVCNRQMQNCRKYERRKNVFVEFRIINRNRVVAPSGVFTRHA